jgi:hypothetical protein
MVTGTELEPTRHKGPIRTVHNYHQASSIAHNIVVDASNLIEANLVSPASSLGYFSGSLGR